MIVLSALGPKSDIAHRTPPPNVDSYADDGVASSRHKAINAAKIAGPRKRPINPKALSPPKIPSNTQINESRAEPPIRSGRTTNEPNASRPSALYCVRLDHEDERGRCDEERSAEGYAGKHYRQSAKQQRMRQSANGVGNPENKAFAKSHEQLTIHRLTYCGYHACSQPSAGASKQPVTNRCDLFDEFVAIAIDEKQHQQRQDKGDQPPRYLASERAGLQFLQQGISAIFHFVQMIWTWSVGQISALLAVPWQQWPLWKDILLVLILMGVIWALYKAAIELFAAAERILIAFASLLSVLVRTLPSIVLAGLIALGGTWLVTSPRW
jgi:hypothetical protein